MPLLQERGARVAGADAFPSKAQLEQSDVLILHAQEAGNIPDAGDRANLNAFLARGGGVVVIHAGAVSRDPDWFKGIVGGSWRHGATKFLEAPMHLYFVDRQHPIVKDASNWSMNDEIYYDMDLSPEAHVLATSYTPKAHDTGGRGNREAQARAAEAVALRKAVNIYDAQPQLWTYERKLEGAARSYRAFVSIPGHLYENFNRPNYRAILLRGIAWAAQRTNVDELCRPNELGDALRYPEGGPTHPARAAEKIEVHPEFNLSLVAAEPLINKVMNIDWDERGRLWVCETPEYPNGRRAPTVDAWKDSGALRGANVQREPEDRISVLSDTNGDGVMDQKHVFADKLELVTSFVLHKNGVIAACSPDIWFLDDTDGDGVADRRTKLYTGLGINDTHAVINNLRWGNDGWIYATHGYSRGEVTSGDGTKKFGPDGSGVVRFKPDGSAFEQFNSRNGNSWGLQVTWDGQVFWTQPTSGTVFFHSLLPETLLAQAKISGTTSWKGMITNHPTFPLMTWPEQAYVQIDQVGRFTAAAGCAIYEGGAWPERWNYSYFTGEPTLNIVHHQFVRPSGVSYTTEKEKGREETEFLRSRDLWFRPIETRIGPDGALYVVDFYNQAVIHNDTRGPQHGPANAAVRPDRDHYFARIWRVQHKQAKKLEVPVLDRRNLAGLISTIKTSPNAHVKQTALRLVREEHGKAGAGALAGVLPAQGSKAEQRYAAARKALTPAAQQGILAEFAAAQDDWTKSALLVGATNRATEFVLAALRSNEGAPVVSFVSGLVPHVPAGARVSVLEAAAGSRMSALSAAVVRSFARSEQPGPAFDATIANSLRRLIQNPDTAAAALSLVARWDTSGLLKKETAEISRRLADELQSPQTPEARRVEIAAGLVALEHTRAEALSRIAQLLGASDSSADLVRSLLTVMAEQSGERVDGALVSGLAGAYRQPTTRSSANLILDQILKRPSSSLALLAAIKEGTIRTDDLGPGNIARLRTHPGPRVASRAAEILVAGRGDGAKDDVIAKLLPEVLQPGDVANGRLLFTGACSVCHRFGDVGQRDVGPPLAGIGAKGPAELLAHIVDPNRQVEPNFWQWNITSKKGETFVGVIASENSASLTLRNQGGDTEIKKENIAQRENTRRSLMPEGLEGLGGQGLRDVIAFMVAGSGPPRAAPTTSTPAPAAEGPKEGGRGDAPLPPTTPVNWEPGKAKVMIIGGGSSHNFGKFFGEADSATLKSAGFTVHYTEDRDQAASELRNADVAIISVNRKFFDSPAYRKAVFDFAAAGKGLVMLHPGTWYGYAQWPELNAKIVGGGARGHDRIAKFTVNTVQPAHPIMKGVPATFEVEDELYYINAEPEKIPSGTAAIEVVAETSPSVKFKQPHPAVWITKHEKARIVGITIGHDQRVHDLDAYKKLLANAARWASGGTR